MQLCKKSWINCLCINTKINIAFLAYLDFAGSLVGDEAPFFSYFITHTFLWAILPSFRFLEPSGFPDLFVKVTLEVNMVESTLIWN